MYQTAVEPAAAGIAGPGTTGLVATCSAVVTVAIAAASNTITVYVICFKRIIARKQRCM